MKKLLSMTLMLALSMLLVSCTPESPDYALFEESDGSLEVKSDASVLSLCNLTENDLKAAGAEVKDAKETSSTYAASIYLGENSFDDFSTYVNALAEKCSAASLDGKIYEDEISWKEAEINLDKDALVNIQLFVYKTSGHSIYVSISDGANEDNHFDLNITVY